MYPFISYMSGIPLALNPPSPYSLHPSTPPPLHASTPPPQHDTAYNSKHGGKWHVKNLRLFIEGTYGVEASNRLFYGMDQVQCSRVQCSAVQ